MIHDVKIIADSTYLINESVKIMLNEDLSVTADFDDTVLTEQEVNDLIDEFFKVIDSQLKLQEMKK